MHHETAKSQLSCNVAHSQQSHLLDLVRGNVTLVPAGTVRRVQVLARRSLLSPSLLHSRQPTKHSHSRYVLITRTDSWRQVLHWRKRRYRHELAGTMVAHASSAPPSIPGHQLSNEDSIELKHIVAGLLHRDNNTRFPGAQPVSFARGHLGELKQREYFVCEKTDGLRCLLFLHYLESDRGFEPVTFLIDRKNNYYEVKPPIRVPYHANPFQEEAFLYATVLDGELVNDLYPDGSTKLIFYAFDCLAADGENFTDKTLDKRLGALKERVIKPWHTYLTHHKALMPLEPFQVKEKEQQQSYYISHVFDNVMPRLKHGNDGLIFTCKDTK